MHDDVINAVEAPAAETNYEYAERSVMADGMNMFQTLQDKQTYETTTDNA